MRCALALDPADDYHTTFEKTNRDAARFSVIATHVGKCKGLAFEHPARIEKIQTPPAQRCLAFRGVKGDFHHRIVYTKRMRVTKFFWPASGQGDRVITRRRTIIALSAAALASPLSPLAQPATKIWRVGFLAENTRPDSIDAHHHGAFARGMRDLGYVDGKNLTIEWRYADNQPERLPALAAELVRMKVDVIVIQGSVPTLVAQKATTTIPLVFVGPGDPVGYGLVKSLARPGGNTTGLSSITRDLGPKRLEMLLGMAPKLSRVAVLFNPANSGNLVLLKNVQTAAQNTKVKILPVEARTAPDIEKAFSTMARGNAGAVIFAPDALLTREMRQIAERAAQQRLPSIAGPREFTEAGGLMSYGRNQADSFLRTAVFVDKILKGAKPGDLPVEQPTTFELFINGKTAKALGLKIPKSLLVSADKVIE